MQKNRRRGKQLSSGEQPFAPCTCDQKTLAKCRICNVDMCEACIDAHLKDKRTKKHDFVRQDMSLCTEHMFEEKRFFCEQCEEVYCVKCIASFHKKHKSFEVNAVIKTQKKAIDWLLVRCQAKIPKLNWETARFRVMAEMTEKNANDTKVDIDHHFDSLVTALEDKRRELKEEVEAVKNEKVRKIYHELENVTIAVERLQSGIEFTEQATKKGNEKEFLSMRNQIFSRLEELSGTEQPQTTTIGSWDIYLHSPYKSRSIVRRIRIQSNTVKSDIKMVGGEDGLMYTTFMNQSRKFVITLKDESGAKMAIGGQQVDVAIRIPSESSGEEPSNYLDMDVNDNNDGTHTFSYEPKVQGIYYLRTTINGRSSTHDYEWAVEAPLGFGDRANRRGNIQLHPPTGTATSWNRFIGGKYSWKIRRIRCDDQTEVYVGVMMDKTSKKWGWRNGKREDPQEISSTMNNIQPSAINSWLDLEELTFYNNEESGCFIIYHEASGKSEVFKRCPGTAARPFVQPSSYDVFTMATSSIEKDFVEKKSSKTDSDFLVAPLEVVRTSY